MFRAWLILTIPVMATPVAAQSQEAAVALPDASSSDDIVVTALRIPREKLPTGIYWDYRSLFESRIARERAQMFLRCALKSSDATVLRRVVDGEPNSAEARFAQGWIKVTHRGCYPPSPVDNGNFVRPSSIEDAGSSRLDRGVIIEMAMRTYAPDAALTAAMTTDPDVRSRFRKREHSRNRLRLDEDWNALVFASCLVKNQPVLATRVFRSQPGSLLERGLTQTIIIEGRQCVGKAKRVTIDPSLARVYIMDAFYRWVVAARGVDSLIPSDA